MQTAQSSRLSVLTSYGKVVWVLEELKCRYKMSVSLHRAEIFDKKQALVEINLPIGIAPKRQDEM